MDEALEVRRFWFGRLPLRPDGMKERLALWYGSGPEEQQTAELVRSRFGALIERAAAGELAAWADSPRRRLSLILLLDQFPRNRPRHRPRFCHGSRGAGADPLRNAIGGGCGVDARGEALLLHATAARGGARRAGGGGRGLPQTPQRGARGVNAMFASALEYAELHRSIIARFGRFPHRNRALRRANTAEEEAYLAAGAERFGQ